VIGDVVMHAPLNATPIVLRLSAAFTDVIRNFGDPHTASCPNEKVL
jgi:hypothetical protein